MLPCRTDSANALPRRLKNASSRKTMTNAIRIATPAEIHCSAVVAPSAANMGAEVRGAAGGAVLLDAMGTLVRLDDPVGRLHAALLAHTGADVGAAGAAHALRAEIAFYRAHLQTAVDPPTLAALRAACAEAMRPALPEPAASAPAERLLAALMEGIAFAAFPDAAPALRALRAAGMRLVVVSNWDVSLHERLAETGLTPLLDGAVASVEVGASKPDAVPFARGLELAGVPAS